MATFLDSSLICICMWLIYAILMNPIGGADCHGGASAYVYVSVYVCIARACARLCAVQVMCRLDHMTILNLIPHPGKQMHPRSHGGHCWGVFCPIVRLHIVQISSGRSVCDIQL